MTLDEILTEYEALWRQAALEDAKQLYGNTDAAGPYRGCAWLIARYHDKHYLIKSARFIQVLWAGSRMPLSHAMVYANSDDHWDWLTLATKFRARLAEEAAKASA